MQNDPVICTCYNVFIINENYIRMKQTSSLGYFDDDLLHCDVLLKYPTGPKLFSVLAVKNSTKQQNI